MRDKHVPDLEFVERLQSQIGADIRRRNRYDELPRWSRSLAQSPIKAAVAAGLLMLVSMGVGGIVVAAAYQAQSNEQRGALKAHFTQLVSLAQSRVGLASEALKTAERQFNVGVEPQDTMLEARFKLAEAQAQLESAQLDVAEVDASGREPMKTASAALVGGRDFVGERWKVELRIPMAALDVEKTRLQILQRRFAVGAANNMDLEGSRARILELESSIQALQTKIGIRQRFLAKQIDASLADLFVLEAEAVQRRQTIAPRLELAQKVVSDVQQKVEIGLAAMLDVSQAQLKLKELELEMSKVDVDLALVRRRIEQQRAGK